MNRPRTCFLNSASLEDSKLYTDKSSVSLCFIFSPVGFRRCTYQQDVSRRTATVWALDSDWLPRRCVYVCVGKDSREVVGLLPDMCVTSVWVTLSSVIVNLGCVVCATLSSVTANLGCVIYATLSSVTANLGCVIYATLSCVIVKLGRVAYIRDTVVCYCEVGVCDIRDTVVCYCEVGVCDMRWKKAAWVQGFPNCPSFVGNFSTENYNRSNNNKTD